MNTTPHTHNLAIRDYGSSWTIGYGDQVADVHKVIGRPWESDESRVARNMAKVKRAVYQLIREHDRKSRLAELSHFTMPTLRDGEWGSDQL